MKEQIKNKRLEIEKLRQAIEKAERELFLLELQDILNKTGWELGKTVLYDRGRDKKYKLCPLEQQYLSEMYDGEMRVMLRAAVFNANGEEETYKTAVYDPVLENWKIVNARFK